MAKERKKNRLRELRLERKLTQEEVAKLLDIDNTTVSKHETGLRGLSLEDIRKYARLYKVEPFELFVSPEDIKKGVPLRVDVDEESLKELEKGEASVFDDDDVE